MLFDTHTHLDDARYNEDREAMIARAREAGVEAFITIGCDLATSRARFETALAIDDSFAETHGSLAVLDVLAGDVEEAKRKSEIALRLDRQCYSAALARSLLAASSGDRETARRIFERAASTPIDSSGRTIGQALARMGLGLS